MNDVSFHVPYIFGNRGRTKIQRKRKTENQRGRTEGTTEDREVWYQERPMLGLTDQREAKLTQGNLQISKCLCIIIRSC